ncbi:I78 family peptidase inhibitor [Palleronia sp. LCG004]|uniref:I78 family peptidase inhibitor n=1 Tax=Palleronia sp. LCG004 TaxID=3079304 RepID=UPI0029439247|nr:I78 family peptidase inhibitor [Palleronia sp. LCG004]WOI55556.1 I78 family peptidase inhibitor [Palleronia sp. LCG004]
MRAILLLAAPAFLLACQTTPVSDGGPAPDTAACGADALAPFVGGPVADAQQAAGQSITRVYAEGDPVTMDYLPERVNIVTDGSGRVIRIACG